MSIDTRWSAYSFVAALVIAFACFVLPHWSPAPASTPLADSAVLISNDLQHGSGVHIGGGYIVTAAHVVNGFDTMDVTDDRGTKRTGNVLWANKTYDLALLHVDDAALRVASLVCHPTLALGQSVVTVSNPLNLQFIHIQGRVASAAAERTLWKTAFTVDMTIAPGMSGGGLFDKSGGLVGIIVGVAQLGPSVIPIGYVVPSSAICNLMARV